MQGAAGASRSDARPLESDYPRVPAPSGSIVGLPPMFRWMHRECAAHNWE
jgi:hypothetical protein